MPVPRSLVDGPIFHGTIADLLQAWRERLSVLLSDGGGEIIN